MKKIFITATDTDAGKTFVGAALCCALVKKAQRVAVFKPISAGCEIVDNQLVNEDAKLLSQLANCDQIIKHINPIAYKEAIAPHIAAAQLKQNICISDIRNHFAQVTSLSPDFILIEGAGGWRLPLGHSNNRSLFLSDFVKHEKLDVILVVNMKLGCLNHALLTFEAIVSDGLNCIAWVANNTDEKTMSHYAENIRELETLLPVPKIAQLDYIKQGSLSTLEKVTQAASHIDINQLLE